MDLGCLDMGCIEKPHNEAFLDSGTNPNDPPVAPSTNKASKEAGQSNLNALNRLASQIKKPPHRKSSPLNWFPRKKVDSYLKRKIRLLQEVGGMNSTLDETLGDSHPHYSRVLREKIAVREAAQKAIEARKAAMVEASWCRILQAARIQSKEAEAQLFDAEKSAAEAFEAATASGVIMYDMPDCPQKHCEIETSSVNAGGSTTHTVAASFETAFEVDKQVATAVKTAFAKLASCPSINKDDFKELLRRISQHPDTGENNQELLEFSSECESDTGSELEPEFDMGNFCSQEPSSGTTLVEVRQRKSKRKQPSEKFNMTKLVDVMLERLKSLQEDELASLATIVATCGLNAALAEAENSKQLDLVGSSADCNLPPALSFPRRMSSFGAGIRRNSSCIDAHLRTNQVETQLPSLDKFLVKHFTKLEREVQEAKDARMNEAREVRDHEKEYTSTNTSSSETTPDFGTILVKHPLKIEEEIELTKRNCGKSEDMEGKKSERRHNGAVRHMKQDVTHLPSLDKFLVRHVSKLEREVQEAKNRKKTEPSEGGGGGGGGRAIGFGKKATSVTEAHDVSERDPEGKENIDLNKKGDGELEMEKKDASVSLKLENAKDWSSESSIQFQQTNLDAAEALTLQSENGESEDKENSLDKILAKPVHRLEREKMQALSMGMNRGIQRNQKNQGGTSIGDTESLDKVLVKHVSRLEKEKLALGTKEEGVKVKRREFDRLSEKNEGSLDQILVKHKSRLEKEKMAAAQQPDDQIKHSVARREARERELQEAWGGLSLGNSMLEEGMKVKRREFNNKLSEKSEGSSLDQILVKHNSRLEMEKTAAAQQPDDQIKHSVTRREARERELQEAWGGLSLGNSMRPHLSRLQRDKAVWLKAEEEERRRSVEEM